MQLLLEEEHPQAGLILQPQACKLVKYQNLYGLAAPAP